MWSLIDLAPLDTDIDEKAENVRTLIETLNKVGYNELALRVKRFDETTREAISADYKALPRCVYQGDLNGTNILSENGHFKGLIDFNLSGTEVNINCFLNETNWFPSDYEFDTMDIEEIVYRVNDYQNELLKSIFKHYSLNPLESRLFPYYKRIVDLEQYPNVCQMVRYLKDGARREKAVRLVETLISK